MSKLLTLFLLSIPGFCLKLKLCGKAAVINGVLGFCNNPVLIINLAFKSCYRAMHFGGRVLHVHVPA